MRLCPTVEGSPSPLIRHRIGAEACQAQQRTHFHKCHRCVYRGKAADWSHEHAEETESEVSNASANGAVAKRAAASRDRRKAKPAPAAKPVEVEGGTDS